MSKHHLGDSPSGLWTAFYMSDAENVTLYARGARMWKFVLDADASLGDFKEIAAPFADATRDDLLWLADTLQSVETWLETCPHDLARFGEVGVSY